MQIYVNGLEKKLTDKEKADIEHNIGLAIRKLGYTEIIWVTIGDD